MCGIVGYLGNRPLLPVLLEGLRRLEYRGYDSAGVVFLRDKALEIKKVKGRVYDLEEKLFYMDKSGTTSPGLGHTRWATHGEPSDENAHPHFDCRGKLALVHNGIIENYYVLKRKLIQRGHRFLSETDTEVIVHLVEDYQQEGFSLWEAFLKALRDLQGAFALALISPDEPDKILVARYQSPLIIGVGEGEVFLASDIPALLPFTKRMIFLEDGEVALLQQNNLQIFDFKGTPREYVIREIHWDISQAEKGGYPHFMLKEIMEQPQALQNTLMGRVNLATGEIDFSREGLSKEWLGNIEKIYIVACGTSYHAGLVGKYLLERSVNIPIEVDLASEFRYRNPHLTERTLFIGISQSGETADTLASLRLAKEKGAKILSICNVLGSSITRESEIVIYTQAGPEISVASTKAFTTQVLILLLLSLYWKTLNGWSLESNIVDRLLSLSSQMSKFLERIQPGLKEIAKRWHHVSDFLYLGRNILYPIALEGALKLKEIAYIHAEGYAAGEMKHGPIALVEERVPTVILSAKETGLIFEKTLSNAEEIRSRRGPIIGVFTEGASELQNLCEDFVEVPETTYEFLPLFYVMPLQLLAYEIAVLRGCDVDRPRNLAKSVTVE
ncbi:MAG: glutamine--fructose-6-phosphate transaminase (isomerizing) [Caldimicrobium sp.]|nr:glutamine--fructose-6-phosphate transaminase (isomerizing) [Caldimicrobium sp.]MDW8183109.1 glutamine--fructose-6-phosphate transaminase (isomerizing) [Caldimicrobium sp.]